MNTNRLPVEYPVQLSREEYVRFQELLSKNGPGQFGGRNRWVPLLMLPIFVVMLAANYRVSGQVDWSLLLLLALVVVVEVTMFFTAPVILRKSSGFNYDQTAFSGYQFDGIVRVTEQDIRKTTPSGDTVVRFADCPLYIETAEVMVFCNTQGRAIVIPARCLTAEDAEATRNAALAAIPSARRRLRAKLIPLATQRLPQSPSAMQEPEEALLTLSVDYTEKEWKTLFTDTAWEQAGYSLPSKSMLALTIAIVACYWQPYFAVPVFLLALLVLFLWPIAFAGKKAMKAVAASEGNALHAVVELTENSIAIHGRQSGGKSLRIPWSRITRAVERPEVVEFYVERKLLTIPKRCIPDMEELRTFVDSHMEIHQ